MSFAQLSKYPSDPEVPSNRHVRPKFHHRCTMDRLREGSGRPPSFPMSRKVSKDRKSIFRELGLDTDEPRGPYSSEREFTEITGLASPTSTHVPETGDDNRSGDGKGITERQPTEHEGQDDRYGFPQSPSSQSTSQGPWYSKLPQVRRPRIKTASSAPPPSLSTITKLSTIALLIAVLLPGFSYYHSRGTVSPSVADAGPTVAGPVLDLRADSLAGVSRRWPHQGECFNPQRRSQNRCLPRL